MSTEADLKAQNALLADDKDRLLAGALKMGTVLSTIIEVLVMAGYVHLNVPPNTSDNTERLIDEIVKPLTEALGDGDADG